MGGSASDVSWRLAGWCFELKREFDFEVAMRFAGRRDGVGLTFDPDSNHRWDQGFPFFLKSINLFDSLHHLFGLGPSTIEAVLPWLGFVS